MKCLLPSCPAEATTRSGYCSRRCYLAGYYLRHKSKLNARRADHARKHPPPKKHRPTFRRIRPGERRTITLHELQYSPPPKFQRVIRAMGGGIIVGVVGLEGTCEIEECECEQSQ